MSILHVHTPQGATPAAPIYPEKLAERIASPSGSSQQSLLTRLISLPRPLAVAALGLMFCPGFAAAAADQTKLAQSYGKLPLSFEANQGQSNAQVKFLAHGPGYALFLTPTEAVLSLKKTQPLSKSRRGHSDKPRDPKGTVLRMQWAGANPTPRVVGQEELPGKVNYLLGKDPSKWRTGVPTYAKVKYEAVYPGVDLLYYGNQRQLEYDLVLAPGADPDALTLSFEGADRLEVDTGGELVVHTAGGDLRMHKPLIYQEVEGVRRPIGGGYMRKNARQVGFQVAAYERARPLVIDPVLVYSTYLGGTDFDLGSGIAVDRFGQAYVTGVTDSDTMLGGSGDALVAKLNRAGSQLVYSTYLGGSGHDLGIGIAVDRFGQAHVTGDTDSTDFPIQDPLQPALGGCCDAFVAKLNRTGSKLVYSTYLGGTGFDDGSGIAVDRFGRAYVTGRTWSTDFPTQDPLQPALGGLSDAFVAKLNRAGSKLVYSTYLGGTDFDDGSGIAVDRFGRAYVTGRTFSTDFPIHNPLQSALSGSFGPDAFVAKLNRAGSKLVYSTYLGGSDNDDGTDIAVDRFGRAYVTGSTFSTDFPIHNPLQSALSGSFGPDAFVAKLNRAGPQLVYSTYLGGTGHDGGGGITVDHSGHAYVTGSTGSPDFPTENPLQSASGGGCCDAFMAKLNRTGSKLVYSTYLGGNGYDVGNGIAVDRFGQAYVTGDTNSTDFPIQNPLQSASGGFLDAFVAKICDPIKRDEDGSEGECDRGDDRDERD